MIDQSFVDKLSARLAEHEADFSNPVIASDQQKLRQLLKEHSRLKKLLEKANSYLQTKRELDENRALLETEELEDELKGLVRDEIGELELRFAESERSLKRALVPPDPNDSRDTIIEIRAGAGGEEAALFAGDLSRMYSRYAESRGWKTDFIDARPSELGGYKEVVFSIQGENAFRALQYEYGTHRVQRIPITEASGRIHTSTVTVAVLPEAEPADQIEIRSEDLRVDVYRASGAGGQHVNKTDSAVRITHLPTGIVVACQEERSQHKNKAKAMRVLLSRLLAARQAKEEEQLHDTRRAQIGSGERSERIRTYNFPQNRMTDHRINFSSHSLDRVLEGELDELIEALHDYYLVKRLDANQALLESS